MHTSGSSFGLVYLHGRIVLIKLILFSVTLLRPMLTSDLVLVFVSPLQLYTLHRTCCHSFIFWMWVSQYMYIKTAKWLGKRNRARKKNEKKKKTWEKWLKWQSDTFYGFNGPSNHPEWRRRPQVNKSERSQPLGRNNCGLHKINMVVDDNDEGCQSLTFDHSMLVNKGRVFDAILDDTERMTDIQQPQ